MGIEKRIKKIMATENISYRDVLDFKKNNHYSSAFKYLDLVNRQFQYSVNSLKKSHIVDSQLKYK